MRTQFKNLRDMYRRKRKKLQVQQEMNHSVDEPGWVYFQRLKFLDESIEFSPYLSILEFLVRFSQF